MYISLYKLIKSGKITWIKSYQTLRKKIEEDKEYKKILDPKTKGEKTGRRFFIPIENVDKLIKAYKDGKIL